MSTYRERLARREALEASLPKREYITNREYAKLKAALTRAKNSGDPARVLKTVEAAVEVFNQKTWPDNWPMWRNALEEASQAARRKALDADSLEVDHQDADEYDRLIGLSHELHAASLILFN
jgi:hypothetical protein